MEQGTVEVVEGCAAMSARGAISFGEVVGRLSAAGVERYHADYARGETTYYVPGGGSHVVAMAHGGGPIAAAFDAAKVAAAVRGAQRGEVVYPEFLKLTAAAGCVGYFVQITGRRVLYFGRNGEVHTEWFPGGR